MADHHERCWRRNQMELALWRYAVTSRQWGTDGGSGVDLEKVPMVFRSRVKKMLNMDRIPAITPWRDKPGNKRGALSEDNPRLPGPGMINGSSLIRRVRVRAVKTGLARCTCS